ncbi:N-acetyltransferase family protein [Roseivirga sp. BDSF3-8]|uniref:GNAT family N-acetyltransferase n=1 Tax=Roseivirga sp. BDSF3-8 TaxID=3241598 RepID=UPI00353190D4
MKVTIRKGVQEDLPAVMGLIQELAVYEKAPDEVENTIEQMQIEGFGPQSVFEFLVAEKEGTIIGLALYFYSYSTWKGKCLYLEDLVVTESERGSGVGRRLFDAVAEVAKNENAGRMQWQVLDWNEPAIGFYKQLGAELDGEWINCKLRREQLQNYTPAPAKD